MKFIICLLSLLLIILSSEVRSKKLNKQMSDDEMYDKLLNVVELQNSSIEKLKEHKKDLDEKVVYLLDRFKNAIDKYNSLIKEESSISSNNFLKSPPVLGKNTSGFTSLNSSRDSKKSIKE